MRVGSDCHAFPLRNDSGPVPFTLLVGPNAVRPSPLTYYITSADACSVPLTNRFDSIRFIVSMINVRSNLFGKGHHEQTHNTLDSPPLFRPSRGSRPSRAAPPAPLLSWLLYPTASSPKKLQFSCSPGNKNDGERKRRKRTSPMGRLDGRNRWRKLALASLPCRQRNEVGVHVNLDMCMNSGCLM